MVRADFRDHGDMSSTHLPGRPGPPKNPHGRGPVYQWLKRHRVSVANSCLRSRHPWGEVADKITSAGILDKHGKPISHAALADVWRRVCRHLAAEPAAKAASAAPVVRSAVGPSVTPILSHRSHAEPARWPVRDVPDRLSAAPAIVPPSPAAPPLVASRGSADHPATAPPPASGVHRPAGETTPEERRARVLAHMEALDGPRPVRPQRKIIS